MLSTTINHYCYITTRWLPPFFPEKSRIVWSQIEAVKNNFDIQHNSVRACLEYLGIQNGVEIHHTGDLPARSGLGSSSSFTVGLLHALLTMNGNVSKYGQLAREAIHIEREILKENVGIQDQIAAAYGGFNHTIIKNDGDFFVKPVELLSGRIAELENHCMLFFTGVSRTASDIAAEQIKSQAEGKKDTELHRMQEMVDEALEILDSNTDIAAFGELLHESWQIKRTLSRKISSQFIDNIYAKARHAGAIGGKLLGAGGGGFMLFFARPYYHDRIRQQLKDFMWVPFKFENEGSEIIFSEPNSYSRESLIRRNYQHVE